MMKDEFVIIRSKNNTERKMLLVKHICCNTEFLIPEAVFQKEHFCLRCEIGNILSIDELKKRVTSLLGAEYSITNKALGKDRARMVLSIKHELCGQTYKVKLRRFLKYQTECPCLTASIGEKAVAAYLNENGIKFNPQYIVKSAQHIFDFAVFKRNSIVAFLEFDGKQHYQPVELFGGMERFKIQEQQDAGKDSYCRKNKVKLIRIPYFELKNIESLLATELHGLV